MSRRQGAHAADPQGGRLRTQGLTAEIHRKNSPTNADQCFFRCLWRRTPMSAPRDLTGGFTLAPGRLTLPLGHLLCIRPLLSS